MCKSRFYLSIASRIQHPPAFSGGRIGKHLSNLLEDSQVQGMIVRCHNTCKAFWRILNLKRKEEL